MNFKKYAPFLLLSSVLATPVAFAADPVFVVLFGSATIIGASGSDSTDDSGIYIGLKAGKVDFDPDVFEDDIAKGLLWGYRFSNGLAVEYEAGTASGDVEVNNATVGDYDFDTKAIYAVYRTPGIFYGKVKVGYLHWDLSVDVVGVALSDDDDEASAGIGGGYMLGPVSFEAEYTMMGQDADLLSIGVNYNF